MKEPSRGESLRNRQLELVQRAVEQCHADLEGRVVVVTGGARGLGRFIVEGLLDAGATAIGADKTWKGAEDFQNALNSSDRGLAVEVDVTDGAAIDAAYDAVIAKFSTVDVLFNNAGLVSETRFAPKGHVPTLDTTDEDWDVMFDVNLFGTVKMIRRFVKPMLAKGHGSILSMVSSGVLMTSLGGAFFGARPWSVEMPYQATKSALTTLTFYLSEELRHQGVAVNAMMPGHTRASWFDDTARAYQKDGAVYALRPLTPEHVLPLVLFLCAQAGTSPEAVTGRLYHIPDWNYDHGFGDVRTWGDYVLPADIEARYSALEAAMPDYWRSGLARAPFDAERVAYGATLEKIRGGLGQESQRG